MSIVLVSQYRSQTEIVTSRPCSSVNRRASRHYYLSQTCCLLAPASWADINTAPQMEYSRNGATRENCDFFRSSQLFQGPS
ncbi:hypothetical protein DTO217A2_3609 [Paecilomyces variotii]|nr:hypothetical protein DTO217A2_3609 [Paecilomyces variotii]KAJ9379361.1 hypothetical protein DTO063F5_7244 [Paecilomyces variotii]